MGHDSKHADAHAVCESLADDEVAFDTSLPIDVLVLECGGGRSVRQIERDAGVSQGQFQRYIGRSRSRKYPTLDMVGTIAKALGTTKNRVSRALAEEAGIPELHAGDPPPAMSHEETQLLEHFRRLPPELRSLMCDQVAGAAEWHDRRPAAGPAT